MSTVYEQSRKQSMVAPQRRKGAAKPHPVTGSVLGNQARQRMGVLPVQATLRVNSADDIYEREADRVADRVMRQPMNTELEEEETLQTKSLAESIMPIQRQAEEEEEETLQAKGNRGNFAVAPEIETQMRRRSGGQPLPDASRRFFEGRMGRDFSNVRIHSGAEAAQAAQSIDARAFTHGRHIVFNQGEYRPQNPDGQRLLAHELAHVVQQGQAGSIAPGIQREGKNDANSKPAIPPELLPIFSAGQTLGLTTAQLYKVFLTFKSIGMSAEEMRRGLLAVLGLVKKNADVGKFVVEKIGESGQAFAKTFGKLGKVGVGLTIFVGAIETVTGILDGNLGASAGAIYRTYLSVALPWASVINAIQGILEMIAPDSVRKHWLWGWVFKVVRSVDPIALGGIAVDSFITIIEAVADVLQGKSSIARLDKLVKRMRGAGAGLFVDIGEDLGDALWEILGDDDRVRSFVHFSSKQAMNKIPAQRKVQMISTLMSGWISDADVEAIQFICAGTNNIADAFYIRKRVKPWLTSMQGLGQRMRVEIALGKMPGG